MTSPRTPIAHSRATGLNYDSDTNSFFNQTPTQERLLQLPEDSAYADAVSEPPSTPGWRESRLRSIGSSRSQLLPAQGDEQQPLASYPYRLYGATSSNSMTGLATSRHENLPRNRSFSVGSWKLSTASLSALAGDRVRRPSILATLKRRPSAYDSPLAKRFAEGDDNTAEKINGVRVWYSSFQSIDWLHDAIKDISRLRRLRRNKSWRGCFNRLRDRISGWLTVTAIGFLTAVVAYLIVRSERWLFDFKEGHCTDGWWKSRSICCTYLEGSSSLTGSQCAAWQTWDQLIDPDKDSRARSIHWAMEYISYTIIALIYALISSLLTIHLTASSSFVTHKDSAVIGGQDVDDLWRSPIQRKIMYYAAGSGIPEIKTILSGFVIHGYLGARVLFTKAVGLSLSVASGLSLGKEGPMVHIASCIGNIISRFFLKYENNEGKRREILSAASAAGVAVAFGAPVGGVLFSLEEVSYFFPPKVMWRSFFGAMIAAMTLKFLDPFGTGKLVLFQVTYNVPWHAYDLLFFLILGLFGGLYGAVFSKLNYLWSKHVRETTWLKKHAVSEVLLVTLMTAMLSFLNPYTRMGGTDLVYKLLSECGSEDTNDGLCVPSEESAGLMQSIAVALAVKGVLTIITFGIKVPAGIFIPTLGVGACFGRIVGIAIQDLYNARPDSWLFASCEGGQNCVVPGLYAMVGAAATLSGVTRTTISLAVIMFELTSTLTYTVPVMLAILVAKTVADALEPKGIYELVIDLLRLPYLDFKHQHLWGGLRLEDAIDREVEVIYADRLNSVDLLRDQLERAVSSGETDGGFPVVREEHGQLRLVGYIGLNELEHALSRAADNSTSMVHFKSAEQSHQLTSSMTSSVFEEEVTSPDALDFTVFMDQAPLTVQRRSPLELVQQLFVKLGARYVIATGPDGEYDGVITKQHWLALLSEGHA